MIRHIAMFRFTPESSNEARESMLAALRTLPDHLPEIRRYHATTDLGLVEGNWDALAVADFDDRDGWRTYTQDPEHLRLIAELVRPILADRAALQYEF